MTIERTKLPREEIERHCLEAVRAYPGLASTVSVQICATRNLYGPTWDVVALTPPASMDAFAAAAPAIGRLQTLFDLEQ